MPVRRASINKQSRDVMNNKNKFYPEFNDENQDRDRRLREELDAEVNTTDLAFNEDEDSYELDVVSEDSDYQHTDPYDTAVRNGSDDNSDYDEANPTAVDEYRRGSDPVDETALEGQYGMHVDDGKIVELSTEDEFLARTKEDERGDLDEEGYPLKD